MLASAPAIAKGSVSEGTNPKTARSEPQASPVSAQWANGSVNDQARRIQRTAGNQAMIGILGKSPNDIGNRSGAQQPETQKLPEAVHLGLKSSAGEPLPSSIASSFSRKFQQDLRSVTVHTDAAAAEAVSGLGANAMARGSELFFRQGAFQPSSTEGQVLLAHELAHVVQQTRAPGGEVLRPSVSEGYAQRASRQHREGSSVLETGPAAPVHLAADTGETYEDEDARASVYVPDPQQINSSPDLRDASPKQIEAYGRVVERVQARTKNKKEKARLGRALENTSRAKETRVAEEEAKRRAYAKSFKYRMDRLRVDIQVLEDEVSASNERRRNTSSWSPVPRTPMEALGRRSRLKTSKRRTSLSTTQQRPSPMASTGTQRCCSAKVATSTARWRSVLRSTAKAFNEAAGESSRDSRLPS